MLPPLGEAYGQPGASLLDDVRDGVGHVIDVLGVERGDADAAGVDGVDRVFRAQPLYLPLAQPGIREHAALREDEAEIGARYTRVDFLDQLLAHGLDALAHGTQLAIPQAAQLRAGEHA